MKTKSADNKFQRYTRRLAVVMFAFLVLVACAIGPTLAQIKSQKRITSLQAGETAAGSRASVFSDSPMSDYEAFRRGDRFYVKIPLAEFVGAQPNLRGVGFEDVQVQRVGDSIVISFKLEPGVNARVDQRSNRLDIYFSATRMQQASNVNPARNREASGTIPGIVTLPSARNHERNPDVAGPMPVDTPTANRPRVVSAEVIEPKHEAERNSQRRSLQANSVQESGSKVNGVEKTTAALSSSTSNANSWAATSDSSSTLTPSATPAYPWAATSVTPSLQQSSRSTSTSTATSSPWNKRAEGVLLWMSSNRIAVSIGGLILLSLVVVGLSMARRRGAKVKTQRKQAKATGVQPKYHPEDDLEDMTDNSSPDDWETLFDNRAYDLTHPDPDITMHSAENSPFQNEVNEWEDQEQVVETPITNVAPRSATISIPDFPMTMTHEEHEREVFEI